MTTTANKTYYGLDASKYPARFGQPWKDEETIKLLRSIQKKKPLEEIARGHERTVGGITAQLKKLAVEYHFNDNRPIEEIQKFTGLSKEIIEDSIRKKTFSDRVNAPPPVLVNTSAKECGDASGECVHKLENDAKLEAARENVRQFKEDVREMRIKVDKILELMTTLIKNRPL